MAIQRIAFPATDVTGTSGFEQTLITAPAAGVTRIMYLWVNNYSAAAESVTVNVVPNGGAVATNNEVVTDLPIGVGAHNYVILDLVIAPSSTVQIAASTANKVTAYGWYQVIT